MSMVIMALKQVPAPSKALGLSSFCVSIIRLMITSVLALQIVLSVPGIYHAAIPIILLVMLLDQLDGMLFRRSELVKYSSCRVSRRVFDSVIDRISVQFVSLAVLIVDFNYLPIFLIVLFREVLVSLPCIKEYRNGYILYPKGLSKISAMSSGAIGMVYLAGIEPLLVPCIAAVVLFSFLSYWEYKKISGLILSGQAIVGKDFEIKAE